MHKQLSFIAILIIILISNASFSQKSTSLFVHKEVKKAIDKGTRTQNGIPGDNYWQNQSDYKIIAEIFPEKYIIEGSEEITYFNNSPDTLKYLYFSIIQNLFKKGVQRDWDFGTADLHDGIDIKSITIDDKSIEMDPKSNKVYFRTTDMIVKLSDYFSPKSKHKIIINWTNIIPQKTTLRNGAYNKTNMMIGYWFPKIKVYDDVYGWNSISHTGRAEFYNEFGNYDVEITTPEQYNLWATGVLQNADDLFSKKYLTRIKKAANSDEVVHIITTEDRKANDVLQNSGKHKWVLKAEYVSDFAFAISKDYLWDAVSVNTGSKRVSVNAVYKVKSRDFHHVAEIARDAIGFFSKSNPKIEFPFPQLTAFNGGGGMEYPAMVNDGDSRNYIATLYLTAHEIGHSYFPFATGLNEQRYAWMDEGLITYFPRKFVKKYSENESFSVTDEILNTYNHFASSEREIPMMVPSFNTGTAYRYHAYSKSSVSYHILCDYLGEQKFNEVLQEFYKRWKGKHPSAYDFFNTFNDVVGEDLSWYFKPWFFEMSYADLAIGKIENGKIQIINKGGLPLPIKLSFYSDGKEIKVSKKADVWKNTDIVWVEIPKDIIIQNYKLNTKIIPDVNPEDNVFESK